MSELLDRTTVSSSEARSYRMSVCSSSDARTRKPTGVVELRGILNVPKLQERDGQRRWIQALRQRLGSSISHGIIPPGRLGFERLIFSSSRKLPIRRVRQDGCLLVRLECFGDDPLAKGGDSDALL